MSFIEILQLLVIFSLGIAIGRFGTLVQVAYFNEATKKMREKRQTEKETKTFEKPIEP